MAKELRGISPAVHQVTGIQTTVPAVGSIVTCEPTLAPHDFWEPLETISQTITYGQEGLCENPVFQQRSSSIIEKKNTHMCTRTCAHTHMYICECGHTGEGKNSLSSLLPQGMQLKTKRDPFCHDFSWGRK